MKNRNKCRTAGYFSFFTILLLMVSVVAWSQTSHEVKVTNSVFSPSVLTIEPGDTVIWVNSEGSHNVNGTINDYPSNPEGFGNEVGTGWTYTYVFNNAGIYNYHCNVHLNSGMTGVVIASAEATLTINFSNMEPHMDQELGLRVYNTQTMVEIIRMHRIIEAEFIIEIPGLIAGESYYVDFFADHNSNGGYNPPPTDHAWRIELNNLQSDTTVNFSHSTEFTSFVWPIRLTANFEDMNPHINQHLELFVRNTDNNTLIDTVVVDEIPGAVFSVESFAMQAGESYAIDFYVDFNENGTYDSPPDDHAWSIPLGTIQGDTTITFTHNTNFIDIFNETTGIRQPLVKKLIVVPNPFKDNITISTDSLTQPNSVLNIYSLSGSMVYKTVLHHTGDAVSFDLSFLDSGTYILKIHEDHLTYVSRIVKK